MLNAGSSSIKFSLFRGAEGEPALDCKGQIEGIGLKPRFSARDAEGRRLAERELAAEDQTDHRAAFEILADWLDAHLQGAPLRGVGHRVVHGGPDFAAPVAVDPALLARLEALVPLAPLHQPHNLAGIRAVQARHPALPQVACFDTAFHRSHPELADRFALPDWLYREGVRRYGFHGLSYESIAAALPEEIAGGRVVVAHLGNGASMCALEAGRSVDSSMAFTALDGIPMGTRPGALDPGVLLYLIGEKGYDYKDLERLLYKESGLLGVSGLSSDLRDLEAGDAPDEARLAIELFVYRIGRELGALAAVLGGLDALVFTAGIGENAKDIRARVCRGAAWLGIALDEEVNAAGGPRISRPDSPASAWVIPTEEEKTIAKHTAAVLSEAGAGAA